MTDEARYSDDELAIILRRALELDRTYGGLIGSQIVDVAREVGISEEATRTALTEQRARRGVQSQTASGSIRLKWPTAIFVGWFVGLVISRKYDWFLEHGPNRLSLWIAVGVSVVAGLSASRDRRPSRFQVANAALWMTFLVAQLYKEWGEVEIHSTFVFPVWIVLLIVQWWLGVAVLGFFLNRVVTTWTGGDYLRPSSFIRRIWMVAKILVHQVFLRSINERACITQARPMTAF